MPQSPGTSTDTPASLDHSHPFVPKDEWYDLCSICGLAQAAHAYNQTTWPTGQGFTYSRERKRSPDIIVRRDQGEQG